MEEGNEDESLDQFYSQGNTFYPRNKGDTSKMEKLLLKVCATAF